MVILVLNFIVFFHPYTDTKLHNAYLLRKEDD
jgi:hypothetical protein